MKPRIATRARGRAAFALTMLVAAFAWADAPAPLVDPMRGPVPIPDATKPPLLVNAVNDDARRPRSYEMQPPTIPHRVDGYQVDKNFNKCLDCHATAKTAFSQAVPVSATHYIDRNGKVLDHVSTRRYFCPQCHVAQDPVRPLVGNSFENVDALARQSGDASKAKPK